MEQDFNEMDDQQVAAQPTQPKSQGPITVSDAITELSACLALVRPVGMDKAAAGEWLTVAANQLVGFPRGLVKIACDAAQRECTHHAQIVPFVLKKIGDMRPWSTLDELRSLPSQKTERIEYDPEIRGMIDHAVKGLKSG